MQSYLKSSEFSTLNKQILFKLRTKMLSIKANFSSMNKNNLQCSFCKDMSTTENEEHLLVCSVLANHPKLKDDIGHFKFENVLSDEQKQFRAVKVFKQIMEIYDRMKSQWIRKTRNPKANNQTQLQHLCCLIWYFLYYITLDLNIYI